MGLSRELIYGNALETNSPVSNVSAPVILIKGKHNGQPAQFGLDESILSKHTLLVGGTGSGKTNLFYHFVRQIKAKMSRDDVMLIFDSKGDFHIPQELDRKL